MAIRGKIYIKNANGTIFFDISDRHASGDNTLKMRLFFNVSDKYKVRKKQTNKVLVHVKCQVCQYNSSCSMEGILCS